MRHCLALLALLLSLPLSAAQLHLELGATQRQWSSDELLSHPQAQTIRIEQDVAYNRPMQYRAVPLAALPGVTASDHLQAVALDGFAAEMPLRRCCRKARRRPGWPWKTPTNLGHRWVQANLAQGRSTWCGQQRRPAVYARSNGRSRSQPCASSPR